MCKIFYSFKKEDTKKGRVVEKGRLYFMFSFSEGIFPIFSKKNN